MGARRIDMHRLQEAVRLHRFEESERTIARRLRIGRNNLRRYFEAFAKAGILDGPADELPDAEVLLTAVEEHVPRKEAPQQVSSVEKWLSKIEHLRDTTGAGPTAIHDFLRLHEDGYDGSLSAVKRLCVRLDLEKGPSAADVAIPVVTDPGEVAQVDFVYAGKRYDPDRGVLRKSWLFVMTLGFSRRMFCKLVFDQKSDTWLRLHIDAFEYLGGVPHVIVPDNLKAAVVRAAFGVDDECALNRSYCELARYYGFQIDPTPPRSPEKKGKVERSGGYVKGNFLKTWESVDIHEDNRQLRRWNEEIADRRKHGTTGRPPIELFEEQEREALRPLPAERWVPVIWKQATLHSDSHVQVDGAFYSAPWHLLHQKLWVRCTPSAVAIYHDDRHLHTHGRVPRGKRSTVEHHLPEHRRDLRHRSRGFWVERARAIDPEVERLVEEIFGSEDVLLRLRRVQSVVTHLEGFPKKRARAAARRALHFGSLEYRSIKNILVKGLDLEPLDEERPREWSQGSRHARKPTEFLYT